MKHLKMFRAWSMIILVAFGGTSRASVGDCAGIFETLASTRFTSCAGQRTDRSESVFPLSFSAGSAFVRQSITLGGKNGHLLSFRIGRSRSSAVNDVGYEGSTISCDQQSIRYKSNGSQITTTILLTGPQEVKIQSNVGQEKFSLICR